MTTNPRPRPALRKAPNPGHPAAVTDDAATAAPSNQGSLNGQLGTGSTSDALRGRTKKNKKTTLRDSELVDVTVEMNRAIRRRLRNAAKTSGLTVDEYLATLLDSTLP